MFNVNFAKDWIRNSDLWIGSNRLTNWATTTAPVANLTYKRVTIIIYNSRDVPNRKDTKSCILVSANEEWMNACFRYQISVVWIESLAKICIEHLFTLNCIGRIDNLYFRALLVTSTPTLSNQVPTFLGESLHLFSPWWSSLGIITYNHCILTNNFKGPFGPGKNRTTVISSTIAKMRLLCPQNKQNNSKNVMNELYLVALVVSNLFRLSLKCVRTRFDVNEWRVFIYI